MADPEYVATGRTEGQRIYAEGQTKPRPSAPPPPPPSAWQQASSAAAVNILAGAPGLNDTAKAALARNAPPPAPAAAVAAIAMPPAPTPSAFDMAALREVYRTRLQGTRHNLTSEEQQELEALLG